MKYFDLMSRFWEENRKQPIGASGAVIYAYLAHRWYAEKYELFAISDLELSGELKIAINTIKKFRKELRDRQLIEFTITPGSPCSYRVMMELTGLDIKVPLKKVAERKKKPVAGSGPTRKKKAPEKQEEKIGLTEERLLSTPEAGNTQIEIPSIEQYLSYAKGLDNYVPEADSEIKKQYDSWAKNRWNNPYNNRPITDWKGLLKNNLQFLIDGNQIEDLKLPRIQNPKI